MAIASAPTMGLRRKLSITAAVLLLFTALVITTVLAVFTDTTSNGANLIATGDVDIAVAPATAAITTTGMAPGGRVTDSIDVSNSGSLDLRYAVRSQTDENVLASVLEFTIKSGVATCDAAGFDGGGTVVYGPAAFGNTTPINIIGNPAQGGDPGDRVLTSGGSEQLCLDVTMPDSAGNGLAGTSTTATFTFFAEQTLANP